MDLMQSFVLFIAFAFFAVFALIVTAVVVLLGRPWLRAFMHGTPVPFVHIVAMRLRGNPPSLLIDAYISLRRAGIAITIGELENTYIDAKNRIVTTADLVELIKTGATSR
jgi:uncharacterized protein YqfA (UPF0365 family)